MFKFTIRDLFWLTLVVGLVLGWATNRRNLIKQLQIAHAQLQRSPCQEYLWRGMAIGFAKEMRAHGWHVHIAEDGSVYGFTGPSAFDGVPERAQELNDNHPLPAL